MKTSSTIGLGLFFSAVLLSGCTSTDSAAVAASSVADVNLPDPLAAGWQGKPVCELLQETAEQRMLRCTFVPGGGHERHYHAPHVGYTLQGGRARLTDANGSREVNLTAGGSAISAGTPWHEMENIGDTTIIYLIVEPK